MKTKILRSLLLLLVCVTLLASLVSCGEGATHTVTFLLNNGADPVVLTVEEGKTPSLPEGVERLGYVFRGWFADEAKTVAADPAATPVTADVVYYADWVADRSFLVSFDTRGGTAVPPVAVKAGEPIDASAIVAPTKEGYTFDGWFKNESCTAPYNMSVAPTANLTLYAGWKLGAGMGECIGIVEGKEIGRTVFPAGLPVFPTTENVAYLWFADAQLTTPFTEDNVTSSVTVYGLAYTDGLTIEAGVVTRYDGDIRDVVVPSVWEGVTVTSVANAAFAGNTAVRTVHLPATITSVGESAFYACTSLLSVDLPEGCKTLGAFAFADCPKLTVIGSIAGISAIPDSAFLGCRRLAAVDFAQNLRSVGNYAFADCAALGSILLPDTVIGVGEYAFSGCTSVTEFNIPRSLVTLGTGALHGCTSLERISATDNAETAFYRVIDGNLYEGGGKKLLLYVDGEKTATSFKLPESATVVAPYAFSGSRKLTELDFDDPNVTLEKGALAGMESLEILHLYALDKDNSYLAYYFGADSGEANGSAGNFSPATLRVVTLNQAADVLPDYAFYGFTGLAEVQGLSRLRKVGKFAFAYTALESVTIPSTLAAIGEKAYYGCTSVQSFTVEDGNATYAAFDGCLYNKELTTLYLVPLTKTEITFSPTVETITAGAFYRSSVRKLEIPSTVKTIEQGALGGVYTLEELSVPFIGGSRTENTYMIYIFGGTVQSSLQSDGTTAYSIGNTSCTPPSLKKLTVREEITALPDFAFAYLSGVTDITYAGTITEIGVYAYCKAGLTSIVVPDSVTKIGEFAFAAMDHLENAVIPGSVGKNLGESLFFSCSKLETVVFGEGVKLIPANCFMLQGSMSMDSEELCYYSALESITLPRSLEEIGEYAFAYAGTSYIGEFGSVYSELRFTLPADSNLVSIGEGAFYRSSIRSISLPSCFVSMDDMAFFGCVALASVTIGNATDGSALASFGGAAFAFCKGLSKLTIYKKVTSVEDLPAIGSYSVATTTENVNYRLFEGAPVPSIYVVGAEIYRVAENWVDYDTKIFEIA